MFQRPVLRHGPRAGSVACIVLALAWGGAAGADDSHFPVPPAVAERLLTSAPFEIKGTKRTAGGVMGAQRLELEFPESQVQLKAKWKAAPRFKADGWNNSPRKELAAYEVQKLFLDQKDFVVPTSAVRCIPLDVYAPIDPNAKPTLSGTSCVHGLLSLWLEDVKVPELLWDPARFDNSRSYAYHIANLNLLAYLINHKDGRAGNILVASDDDAYRVFAVDNGVSFGTIVHNFLVKNWDSLRVPRLPRLSVQRLQNLDSQRIRSLGVLMELRPDEAGVLQPVEPGPNIKPGKGTRIRDGVLQIGLRQDELKRLEKRLARLLQQVESGEIALF